MTLQQRILHLTNRNVIGPEGVAALIGIGTLVVLGLGIYGVSRFLRPATQQGWEG